MDTIKELASETQFTIAINWKLTFDWVDEPHRIVTLSINCVNYRESRQAKPYAVTPYSFVFESRFPAHPAEFTTYTMSSQDPVAFADLIGDGSVRTEHADDGRLVMAYANDPGSAIFNTPPEHRFVVVTESATYVDSIGFYPLSVSRPTLLCTVQLSGTALDDLFISILHPGSGTMRTQCEDIGSELEKRGAIQVGKVFITGQVVLVSWKSQSHDMAKTDNGGVRRRTDDQS
jgi:hypothetical protein